MATGIWSEFLRLTPDALPFGGLYLLYRAFPGFLAIATAEKGRRARVCLEVIRLRRKDAPSIPSYLEPPSVETEKPKYEKAEIDSKTATKAVEASKLPPVPTSPPNRRSRNRRPSKTRSSPDRDLGG